MKNIKRILLRNYKDTYRAGLLQIKKYDVCSGPVLMWEGDHSFPIFVILP